MGMFSRLRFALRAAEEPTLSTFSNVIEPVDQLIVANGRSGWTPSISRESALQVPAILRGRNLICSISTLPLTQYGPNRAQERNSLLDQIDPQISNVVSLAQTVEDLLFDGLSWWKITARGWNDFPASAQHVDGQRVHLNPPPGAQSLNMLPSGADPSAAVWIDTAVVDGRDMIRFDSPNPPLLVAARRAITRAILIEKAAERYAKSPKALGYFTPGEGADPADDNDIAEMLADWNAARNEDAEGYVPASLKYNPLTNPSPADLQLVQLQARASLDIANAIGLDPEDLGVSTTSRTYQNATDRRQDRINDVLAPYMRAITDRLSMNDVTRRGYRVAFDLDDYLKADPITRASVAQTLNGLGAITVEEIREAEGRPVLTSAQKKELKPAPAPAPVVTQEEKVTPVNNSAPVAVTFSDETPTSMRFAFEPDETFAASAEKRTVTGTLLPFGPVGQNGQGRWRFQAGSVEWSKSAISRVKLNREHDRKNLLGAATVLRESDGGIVSSFKVARGAAGDQALTEAEDMVLDGLSAEVDILDYTTDPADASVRLVTKARLTGAALTGSPAFDDARLTSVKASLCEGETMPANEQAPAAPVAAPAVDLSAQIADAVKAAFAAQISEGPSVVSPRRGTALTVREEAPYRFNGERGANEFSSDVFAAFRGDGEAKSRVEGFISSAFSVAKADVDELNPSRQRPDMYVDNLDYSTPIWDAINKGTIADSTPFVVPKFNSASGLVAGHTEGTEPTAGSFTTTSQTITPAPVSGKVEINREVVDQGGNPQVSGLIWREIVRAYNEALEVKAVALLDGLTPTGITLTTAGADAVLEGEITAALAALQYIRGGNRFRDFFLQIDLYKKIIAAKDTNGRKLFPVLGATNATGTVSGDFSDVMIGNLRARPAWALAATGSVAASSYLFNRDDVHGWASAPRKLEFEYQVASVYMGVWGYVATANTRLGGVREFIYDPV